MDTNQTTHEWAAAAVARLVQRATERAALDLEAQARELQYRAAQLRGVAR